MNKRSHKDLKEQCKMSVGDTKTNDLVTSQVPEEAQVGLNGIDKRERR